MTAPAESILGSPARVAAVSATGLLDAPPEAAFDRLVRIAARLLDVPVAVVALVTDSRHVIVSQHGLGAAPAGGQHSLPLDLAPCKLVVETSRPLVIVDIRSDPRATSMCSIADAGIVSYAGVPLRTLDGTVLGSFAALGPKPHTWSEDDLEWLEQLSAAASNELALRAATRRAEGAAADLEVQLHHAQKMEAVGTLAGGIAHDFNNMLVSILGNIEVALAEHPQSADVVAPLEGARRAALRAKALVAQILDFSRGRPPERSPIRLWPVVEDAWRLARPLLPPNVIAEATVDDPNAMVFADATQLHRVVTNLCSNAGVAMRGRSGRVVLRQERAKIGEGGTNTIEPIAPGEYIRLSVRDEGAGMDEDTRRRMFEPFFTRQARGEGTGLGLTMVHAIVHSHDGSLAVESKPGVGTTVDVYLPRIEPSGEIPPDAHLAAAVTADGARAGQPKRILLVDDDEGVIEALERMVKKMKHVPTAFTRPTEALAWLRANPSAVDAVVTDLSMPELDGVRLSAAIHEFRPELPVIVISGLMDDEVRRRARGAGIAVLLMKPFTTADFSEALTRVLNPAAG